MAKLTFETLQFKEEQSKVKVTLLSLAYFYLTKEQLGKVQVEPHKLIFPYLDQERAEKKFQQLLNKGITELKNTLTNNKVIYLHQNSGLPLIGHVAFGLVYRNSSLIEIKPSTSCNLNCIFCSVGEGIKSKKVDFLVEKDYLVEELKKLLKFIQQPVEVHIGVNGEPFLYGDILPLIKDLGHLKQIHTVSVDTNGTLLTKKLIDQLSPLKKTRLNLSLHSLSQKTAQKMAGRPYNLSQLLSLIAYAKDKVTLMLTPLLVPGYNENDLDSLVGFAKKNNFKIGIQNFLYYKTGRNPVQPWPWEKFYHLLEQLEKKHRIKLKISPQEFQIKPAKELPKPFQLNDKVAATVVLPDRFPHSRIAMAKGRLISLPDCSLPLNKKVKVKITRDKHNIFIGKVI